MMYLFIYGTRPEAIKMAPIIRAFKEANFSMKVCVTGQHREMLDQVNSFFEITPDYDLNIMKPNQTLNSLVSRLFEKIDDILIKVKPDWVLVHGDTSTCAVAAWAAFHRGIKVAHVEAGLRTFNKNAPFPEEINRQLTGRIANIHFAPTLFAVNNLLSEGINSGDIIITGNTVIDALYTAIHKIKNGTKTYDLEYLKSIIQSHKRLITITGHRRENFGVGFEELCNAIKEISEKFTDVQLIYPVHMNPHVKEPVYRILGNLPNVSLIPPIDYPSFIYLLEKSYLILTDSGGVQEEAPAFGVPVLVFRENTERPEAIQAGTAKLVGTSKDNIVKYVNQLLLDQETYNLMSTANNPYGDGKAAERIVEHFKIMSTNNTIC